MKYFIFLLALLHLVFIDLGICTCTGNSWTAYKNEKCVKIVDILETHALAVQKCRSLEANSPENITLLTINSEEEQMFFNHLLFSNSNIVDNVWVGARRVNATGEFAWLDGTTIDGTIYSNWAPGKPVPDLGNDCVELRSGNRRSLTMSQKDPGSWHNVPCGKRNLVVCQKFQDLTHGEIHAALLQANWEIKNLKNTLQGVQATVSELFEIVQLANGKINEQDKEIEALKENVRQKEKSSVKNIRFSSVERIALWRGPGYRDKPGYVITGVENDGNYQPDAVSRRKMEKFINGAWVTI